VSHWAILDCFATWFVVPFFVAGDRYSGDTPFGLCFLKAVVLVRREDPGRHQDSHLTVKRHYHSIATEVVYT